MVTWSLSIGQAQHVKFPDNLNPSIRRKNATDSFVSSQEHIQRGSPWRAQTKEWQLKHKGGCLHFYFLTPPHLSTLKETQKSQENQSFIAQEKNLTVENDGKICQVNPSFQQNRRRGKTGRSTVVLTRPDFLFLFYLRRYGRSLSLVPSPTLTGQWTQNGPHVTTQAYICNTSLSLHQTA